MSLRLKLLRVTLSLLSLATIAMGQSWGPPVDLAELSRLAKLSKAEQLEPATQTRLQQWFFQQVGAYQSSIRTSALGRSALVDVGPSLNPPGGIYARTFAPPAGRGTYVIFWSDDVKSPSTWNDGVNLEFPRSGLSLNAGVPSTCWHESLHAVMNPVTLSVRVEDFAPVAFLSRTKDRGEAQQHVYIELFAEKAADWIISLSGFERAAVAAAEALEDLKSRGQVINFEVENFVWAKTQAEWQTRWEKGAKHIKRLPQPVKDEFERVTSTRFPSVEEAIGFYMSGDFKAPAGTKLAGKSIRVPKWVMWPEEGVMPVILEEHDSKAPELKENVWNASFGVCFTEPRWQQHPPVTRGTATITLRSDESSARITVTYGGQTIQPSNPAPGSSWRRFIVNLGSTASKNATGRNEPVRVAVSVKDSPRSPSARELVLPVHIAYRDDLSQKTAAGTPSRYYLDTEGIFLVKVPSTSASPKPTGPPVASGQAAGQGGQGSTTAPRWVLINQWTHLPKASEASTRYKWTCSVSDTGATVDFWSSKYGAGKEWPYNHRLNYSWEMPAYLEPDTTVPLQIRQQSTFTPPGNSMLNRDVSLIVLQYDRSDEPKTLQTSDVFVDFPCVGLGSTRISEMSDAPPAKASELLSLNVPGGRDGQRILIHVVVYTNYNIRAYAYRQYEWRPGTPGTSRPSTAPKLPLQAEPQAQNGLGSIEKQVPPPPPLNKALDEVPPRNGELDAVTGETEPPPVQPSPVRWYTHPQGDYRIRLDRGWRQSSPGRIEGLDQLDRAPGDFLLFPSRQRTMVGNPLDQAGKLAANWMSQDPKARRINFQVAGEAAVAVGMASKDNGKAIALWHMLITRKDRLYYFSVFAPASTGSDRLPAEITDLLSTLEFLTGTPTPPGKTDIASLLQQGTDLHNQKKFAEAVAVLNRALDLDPNSSEAYRCRGMSKREQNDYAGAIVDFTQAVKLDSKDPKAYVGRGIAREKAGDVQGALADYSQGIALDPQYKNAWVFQGTLKLKQKDYLGAISDFDKALQLDPSSQWSAWPYNNRGMAREKLGDVQGARQDYQKALALNPGDENAQKNLNRIK